MHFGSFLQERTRFLYRTLLQHIAGNGLGSQAPCSGAACGHQHGAHGSNASIEFVVNNNVVELGKMGNFLPGRSHTAPDFVRVVAPAPPQPRLQNPQRRRQNKNAHCVRRHGSLQLPKTLPIDIKRHVPPLGQGSFNRATRCAISPAEYNGMLKQLARLRHPRKLGDTPIIIVKALNLPCARRSRGHAYRQKQARLHRQQCPRNRALACPGRCGHHETHAAPPQLATQDSARAPAPPSPPSAARSPSAFGYRICGRSYWSRA